MRRDILFAHHRLAIFKTEWDIEQKILPVVIINANNTKHKLSQLSLDTEKVMSPEETDVKPWRNEMGMLSHSGPSILLSFYLNFRLGPFFVNFLPCGHESE